MDGNVLVITSDADRRELLSVNLRHAGYVVAPAGDLGEAGARACEARPDLVLIDQKVHGGSALSYTRRLRGDPRTAGVAVIVIGCDPPREQDTLAALACGADDCVRRSTSISELLARIQAVMRRSAPQCDGEPLEVQGLCLDPADRLVSADGHDINLSAIEFRLLRYFMTHPERIVSRARLLDEVWGDRVCVEERSVDIHVGRLRRALEPSGHAAMIETVRGMGYRFCRDAATRTLQAPPAPVHLAAARPPCAAAPGDRRH